MWFELLRLACVCLALTYHNFFHVLYLLSMFATSLVVIIEASSYCIRSSSVLLLYSRHRFELRRGFSISWSQVVQKHDDEEVGGQIRTGRHPAEGFVFSIDIRTVLNGVYWRS